MMIRVALGWIYRARNSVLRLDFYPTVTHTTTFRNLVPDLSALHIRNRAVCSSYMASIVRVLQLRIEAAAQVPALRNDRVRKGETMRACAQEFMGGDPGSC